ncbi:MAG: hypothetical protein ACLSD6_07770 [Clostridium sp.]
MLCDIEQKSGKRYYVRVRCVKKKNGVNYYGKWSKVKKYPCNDLEIFC